MFRRATRAGRDGQISGVGNARANALSDVALLSTNDRVQPAEDAQDSNARRGAAVGSPGSAYAPSVDPPPSVPSPEGTLAEESG
jgi:hypothetical protein